MSDDNKAKLGTALSEGEVKALDPAKVVKTKAAPPAAAEVEGQMRYIALVTCPYCERDSWCDESTDVRLAFTCCHCGETFWA